jgi:hypothetical protein
MLFEDKDRKVPSSVCRGEMINRMSWRASVESECFRKLFNSELLFRLSIHESQSQLLFHPEFPSS